jgi:hypothetical protein
MRGPGGLQEIPADITRTTYEQLADDPQADEFIVLYVALMLPFLILSASEILPGI